MKVKITIRYDQAYLPTKRCTKERLRTVEEEVTIEIPKKKRRIFPSLLSSISLAVGGAKKRTTLSAKSNASMCEQRVESSLGRQA